MAWRDEDVTREEQPGGIGAVVLPVKVLLDRVGDYSWLWLAELPKLCYYGRVIVMLAATGMLIV